MHEKTTSGVCTECYCSIIYVESMLSSVRVLQIWVSSPEKASGTITDAAKIVEYEKQWHADIFVPCLKKLGTEVCVHRLFDVHGI